MYVVSVLFRCCICFTYMLQVYVPDISFCFRCILHSSGLCFRGMFRESWDATRAPKDGARLVGGLADHGSHGLADRAC
jgi:hypothetical protein